MELDLRPTASLFVFFHGGNIEIIYLAQESLREGNLFEAQQELFFIEAPLRYLSESTEILKYNKRHREVFKVEFILVSKYLVDDK